MMSVSDHGFSDMEVALGMVSIAMSWKVPIVP